MDVGGAAEGVHSLDEILVKREFSAHPVVGENLSIAAGIDHGLATIAEAQAVRHGDLTPSAHYVLDIAAIAIHGFFDVVLSTPCSHPAFEVVMAAVCAFVETERFAAGNDASIAVLKDDLLEVSGVLCGFVARQSRDFQDGKIVRFMDDQAADEALQHHVYLNDLTVPSGNGAEGIRPIWP